MKKEFAQIKKAAPQLNWFSHNESCRFCLKPLAYGKTILLIHVCGEPQVKIHQECREDYIAQEAYEER